MSDRVPQPSHSRINVMRTTPSISKAVTVTPPPLQGRSFSVTRRRPTAARAESSNTSTILDDLSHCNLSQQDPGHLTGNTEVPECISQPRNDDSQASSSEPSPLPTSQLALAEDLTGQIFGTINDYVASGAFGNVYRCEWRRPSGSVKVWPVAVKAFRNQMNHTSEQDLRRFRRETAIWAHLVHDNIVTLYGTTEGFGPTTALVSRWFPHGTLFRLITEQGATLTIESKLKLLHGIASGLYYLHSFPVVHGDITSSNVLVDLQDGEYKACLTDFGLSNVLCGHLKDCPIEGSTVRHGAIKWTAPELLMPHDHPSEVKPTTHNDMYSFGRVMFHLLTLVVLWHDIDDFKVIQKIQSGEDIPRPEISEATSDVTDARWNHIEQCWSIDPSARPCAFTAMNFINGELDDVLIGEVQESPQSAYLVAEQVIASVLLSDGVQSKTTVSLPSLPGPLNVILFGETGVGKSAIINLIMGRDAAQTSPDAETCTVQHTSHEVMLGTHRFKLWEVS
ncbi:kinase-like domain-containing protein [Suillus lakei]|nr:kinase-like domain-containing protein [Suillus lakei]